MCYKIIPIDIWETKIWYSNSCIIFWLWKLNHRDNQTPASKYSKNVDSRKKVDFALFSSLPQKKQKLKIFTAPKMAHIITYCEESTRGVMQFFGKKNVNKSWNIFLITIMICNNTQHLGTVKNRHGEGLLTKKESSRFPCKSQCWLVEWCDFNG